MNGIGNDYAGDWDEIGFPGVDDKLAKEMKALRERTELQDKLKSRPRVRYPRRCAKELEGHKDFVGISGIGIELAAIHASECLDKPNAVLLEAYWAGNTLLVKYCERTIGNAIEGLFDELPAYDDGPIIEDELQMGQLAVSPSRKPDDILLDLGFSAAQAHEIEALLGRGGWNPREAIRSGLANIMGSVIDELRESATVKA